MHNNEESGEEFSITGPVSNFKVSFEVKEGNADFSAGLSKIAFKSIDFTLPQVSIQSDNIAFKEHDHAA